MIITPQAFLAVWRHLNNSEPPSVFQYRTEGMDELDVAVRREQQLVEEIVPTLTDGQRAMFTVLATAKLKARVLGLDETLGENDQRGHTRVYSAGVASTGAVIAAQTPGTGGFGGNITVSGMQYAAWPKRLVEALPDSPGAGHIPAVYGFDDNFSSGNGTSIRVSATPDPVVRAKRAHMEAPSRTTGIIEVTLHDMGTAIPAQQVSLYYRDIDDDGRYALTQFGRDDLIPADAATMTSLVSRCFSHVTQRFEDLADAY
ncbi:hypothetical protein GCM10027169_04290 [Gordonia jinhuaensis]|uniref:EspG family protein n=1 Tax=Gordonia jinhuaensis TaxID=1517702 RepID=A0A916SW81_9ACTN|nr:ESX secretion-associated protein EspG [Gordonia jinhuaensis]GGB16899.1 hypothetical protein GCM10011489_01250 [Gordonia jinhuaensis]